MLSASVLGSDDNTYPNLDYSRYLKKPHPITLLFIIYRILKIILEYFDKVIMIKVGLIFLNTFYVVSMHTNCAVDYCQMIHCPQSLGFPVLAACAQQQLFSQGLFSDQ